MFRPSNRLFALLGAFLLALGLLPAAAFAQEGGSRYDDPAFGIAFDLPAGWEVETQGNELYAASRPDLDAVLAGSAPQGLALRVIAGTFDQLGVSDAAQLPDLLARLASYGEAPSAPEPVQLPAGTGHQIVFTLPADGLTTRVVLLEVAGGRVAIVRGIAPTAAWDGGAGAAFDALLQSMTFTAPQQAETAVQAIESTDGGVLWHYQAPPDTAPNIRAGGLTYDEFGILYMAAGPGGVLALDMANGTQISLMGPWGDAADYIDVAIGPDTLLYLANAAPETTQAVVVVDRAGNYGRGWGLRGDGEGQFAPGMPRTIAVNRGGEVWTVSEGHAAGIRNRLYKFDPYGNLLLAADLDTVDPALSGIRIDANLSAGTLYLAGAGGSLTVLDANGQPLARNLASGVLDGVTVADLAVAPNDDLLVALAAPGIDGRGLLSLSMAGQLLDLFGVPYDEARGGPFQPGEYRHPAGLVVTSDGTPHWSESQEAAGSTQIQAFTFIGDGQIPVSGPVAAPDPAQTAAPPEAPASAGPLAAGTSVRGYLDNNTPIQEWPFEGRAGEHVVISMIDASGEGALDPLVNLLDANGRVIASNDDVGSQAPEGMSERDARLEFALPATGTYVIEAARFGGRGEYVLTYEVGP